MRAVTGALRDEGPGVRVSRCDWSTISVSMVTLFVAEWSASIGSIDADVLDVVRYVCVSTVRWAS